MLHYVIKVTMGGAAIDLLGPYSTAEQRDAAAREHVQLVADYDMETDTLCRLDVERGSGQAFVGPFTSDELCADDDDLEEEGIS